MLKRARDGPARRAAPPQELCEGPAGRRPDRCHLPARLAPAGSATAPGAPGRTRPTLPGQDEPLADVVPLGVFDAREEAKNWW